jgi:hypothetical protein
MLTQNSNTYGVVGDILGGDPVGLNAWGQTEYLDEAVSSGSFSNYAAFPVDENVSPVVMPIDSWISPSLDGGLALANSSSPYIFNAAMATTFKNTAGAQPTSGPINIAQIVWLAPMVVGDSYVLTNEFGIVISTYVATATTLQNGFYQRPFKPAVRCRDFQLTTLSSGLIFIYTC